MNTSWGKIISIAGFIMIVTVIIYVYGYTSNIVHPQSNIDLPNVSEMAYKEIGHNMMHETLYEIYGNNGYITYVTESQFNTIQIPQKIGDSLYKMPNGDYVTGLIK
jgi:hypothetical protein